MPRARSSSDAVSRVHRIVQQRAVNYELRPGEHVNELALAKELKISRTPIREALNRLVSEGLISFVPNKGFYARSFDIASVRNLFEARSEIEATAVRLACRRADAAAIKALADYWTEIKAKSRSLSIAEIAAHDEAFHERLVGLAGNDELVRIIRDINLRIRFVRIVAMEFPHYRRITFDEHLAILAEIAKRKPAAATRRIEKHISLTLNDTERIGKESVARIYLHRPQIAKARAS
jgi:DNA-binding GntR family transcriptional regulator